MPPIPGRPLVPFARSFRLYLSRLQHHPPERLPALDVRVRRRRFGQRERLVDDHLQLTDATSRRCRSIIGRTRPGSMNDSTRH